MRTFFGLALAAILALSSAAAAPALAQDALRAAAVVNDDVISMLDLNQRTRLTIASIGAQDSPQMRQRLTPQVLRSMIDERLQLQEAERLSLEVSEQEVDEAFAAIAQQNNMSAAQFGALLTQNGILPETVRDQARAELAWRKVIERRIRPQIVVSQEQLDAEIERLKSQEGRQQYRVAEVFLGVDNPSDEARVRENIERLVEELKKGAPFQGVARQFSESTTASVGGDLGWVTLDQLDPAVAKAVGELQEGGLAGPIRGIAGYYIVGLIGQRTFKVGEPLIDTRAIGIPLPPGADQATVEERMRQMTALQQQINGCADLQSLASSVIEDAMVRNTGKENPESMPPDVARAVEGVSVGKASAPFRRADAIMMAVICGRESAGIDRERIQERLVQEQIELRARRYIRDLRRSADMDIRI